MDSYPSRLLAQAVNELARLPGIGRRTALRMALHLLRRDPQEVESLGQSVIRLRNDVLYCSVCHNISDEAVCAICASPKRDRSIVCVVEDIRDVMAIENTGQFTGLYHVLGGIISPIEGIGPQDLQIEALMGRVATGEVAELIFALPATIEGDTTGFYIYRKLKGLSLRITTIARGISVGDELEHTDEVTLGRSIVGRLVYEGR